MVDVLEFKKKGITKQEVVLTNKHTGSKKTFLLRPFAPGDEEGIISCVKEEHQDSYFKTFFYDPALLKEKAEGKEYIFFVAEVIATDVTTTEEQEAFWQQKNKIAGIEILRIFGTNGDDYIEPASQMIRKENRGFRLSEALVDYTFAVAKALKPASLFVHTAMYHNITQRVCESYGMVPVGYEIGSFLTEVMENSFSLKDIKKYSAGTLCYPVEKRTVADIYLPKELHSYGELIYKNLGVSCKILGETDASVGAKQPETSRVIVSKENLVNRYITIDVRNAGDDLYQIIENEMAPYVGKDGSNPKGWVFHLILNADTFDLITHYKRLKEMGFFFGSMQPLCGDHERVFLYWVGDLDLHMEVYEVTKTFDEIRNHIIKFYKDRTI